MKDLLTQSTVLVLNRNWQAIHVKTPAEAFCMMASGSGRALDIQGEEVIVAVGWSDWLALPIREQDHAVGTPRGLVRCPTVLVVSNYARVPMRQLGFNRRNLWRRDGGVCQYTGRKLAPNEGNIDHVIPRARGGKTSWENCVLAHKEINSRKADRLPQEVGLRLLRPPSPPKMLPASALIQNLHNVADWKLFLG